MNKTMDGVLVRSVIGVLIVIGFSGAAIAGEQSCERIRRAVEAAVPASVGSPAEIKKMLSPRASAQFSRNFSVQTLERALRDELSVKATCSSRSDRALCGGGAPFTIYENTHSGSTLLVDVGQGRILYANAQRRFQGRASEIGKREAEERALRTLAQLGVPRAEVGRTLTNAVMSASQSIESGSKPRIVRAEVNVRILRTIGGIPVYGSDGRVAIDAAGEIARLQLSWPDFRLVDGLAPRAAIPRAEVVAELLESIIQDSACASIARVESHVVYVPSHEIESPGKVDGARDATGFMPALVAIVTPLEPEEDSGRTTEAEQQLLVPLFAFGEDNGTEDRREAPSLRTLTRPAAGTTVRPARDAGT